MSNKKSKDIAELGEFGLINHLTSNIRLVNESSETGIGDDAAVLNYKEKRILVTTDILMEGIHFNLVYTPLKHLGYKAAVINFSDIYAMNGYPKQIVVSIALSKKISLEAVEEIYEGIKLACSKYNVDLIGGDTSSSLTGMAISITALGEAKEDKIVYRSNAKENDLICVSGNLGAAYAGLQLLERENQAFQVNPHEQPDLSDYSYILERQLKPEARKDIIELLEELEVVPTSMIDISDGLSSELLHICSSSDKGCKVYQDKIPIRLETIKMANEINIEPIICALNGGEDYELLFTASLNDYEKINNFPGVSIIGHITDKKEMKTLVTPDGNTIELLAQGWKSF